MEKTERELLIESNELLRSCYSVIERRGINTNWEGIDHKVEELLKELHSHFYPTLKDIRRKKLNRLNEQNPE
jgi:hypothetical protein